MILKIVNPTRDAPELLFSELGINQVFIWTGDKVKVPGGSIKLKTGSNMFMYVASSSTQTVLEQSQFQKRVIRLRAEMTVYI